MTQEQIIENNRKTEDDSLSRMRKAAQERNAELKQQAAARLKKNAENRKRNKLK